MAEGEDGKRPTMAPTLPHNQDLESGGGVSTGQGAEDLRRLTPLIGNASDHNQGLVPDPATYLDEKCSKDTFRKGKKQTGTPCMPDIMYSHDDLFSAPAHHALVHCVSSDCAMSAGIATSFSALFGDAAALAWNPDRKPGSAAIYKSMRGRLVIYLVTKTRYNEKPTLVNFKRSLKAAAALSRKHGASRWACPLLGCGLDGLDEATVSSALRATVSKVGITVTIHKPTRVLQVSLQDSPGVAAVRAAEAGAGGLTREVESLRAAMTRVPAQKAPVIHNVTSLTEYNAILEDEEEDLSHWQKNGSGVAWRPATFVGYEESPTTEGVEIRPQLIPVQIGLDEGTSQGEASIPVTQGAVEDPSPSETPGPPAGLEAIGPSQPDREEPTRVSWEERRASFVDALIEAARRGSAGSGLSKTSFMCALAAVGSLTDTDALINSNRQDTVMDELAFEGMAEQADMADTGPKAALKREAGGPQPAGQNSREFKPTHVRATLTSTQKAKAFAEKICDQGSRVLGVMLSGPRNRAWTTAVCRALRLLWGDRRHRNTDEGSDVELHKVGNLNERGKKALSTIRQGREATTPLERAQFLNAVRVWSRGDVALINIEGHRSKGDRDIAAVQEEGWAEKDSTNTAVPLILAVSPAVLALTPQSCPICMFDSVTEGEINALPSHSDAYPSTPAMLRLASRSPAGLVHALARKHNKEQHALNGNIYMQVSTKQTRELEYEQAIIASREVDKGWTVQQLDPGALANQMVANIQVIGTSTAATNNYQMAEYSGVLHQVFIDFRNQGDDLGVDAAGRDAQYRIAYQNREALMPVGNQGATAQAEMSIIAAGVASLMMVNTGEVEVTCELVPHGDDPVPEQQALDDEGPNNLQAPQQVPLGVLPAPVEEQPAQHGPPQVGEGEDARGGEVELAGEGAGPEEEGGALGEEQPQFDLQAPQHAGDAGQAAQHGQPLEGVAAVHIDFRAEPLRWVSVSQDNRFGNATLISHSTPELDSQLQNQRLARSVWGQMVGVPTMRQIFGHPEAGVRVDMRPLALRTYLLEMSRDWAWSDPFGQAWVTPTDADRNRFRFPAPSVYDRELRSVIVTPQYLNNVVTNVGFVIPVRENGVEVEWSVIDSNVVVVALDLSSDDPMSQAAWTVAHLDYPRIAVGEVVEGLNMADTMNPLAAGDAHPLHRERVQVPDRRQYASIRTSSLVRVPNVATRIVFVLTTGAPAHYRLGMHDYPVNHINRDGTSGRVEALDFTAEADHMVNFLLDSPSSIVEVFDTKLSGLGITGLDWGEIATIASYLTVRYPAIAQISQAQDREGDDWVAAGMPQEVIDLFDIPAAPYNTPITPAGHLTSVLGFDHKLSTISKAIRHPVLTLGNWPNPAEIALVFKMATFQLTPSQTPGVTGINDLRPVCYGALDRALYIRKAYETWAQSSSLGNALIWANATPMAFQISASVHAGDSEEGRVATPRELMSSIAGADTLAWSWAINDQTACPVYDHPGRIHRAMWMTESMSATARPSVADTHLKFEGTEGVWNSRRWVQPLRGDHDDDAALHRIMFGTNPVRFLDELLMMSHPTGQRGAGATMLLDFLDTTWRFRMGGLVVGLPADPIGEELRIGYDLKPIVRTFRHESFSSLTFPEEAQNRWAQHTATNGRIWTSLTLTNQQPGTTTRARRIKSGFRLTRPTVDTGPPEPAVAVSATEPVTIASSEPGKTHEVEVPTTSHPDGSH